MNKLCLISLLFSTILYSNNFHKETVHKVATRLNIPSYSVAIIKNDEVTFKSSHGHVDHQKKKPIDDDSLYCIGSISKGMTAFLVGTLVDQHRLDWDDKVTTYLPEFFFSNPATTAEITIKDLLTHQCGFMGRFDATWINCNLNKEQVMHRIKYLPSKGLRTRFLYQNLSYAILGLIIEKITGTSFDNYLQTTLAKPLSMRSISSNFKNMQKSSHLVQGYSLDSNHKPTFLIDPTAIAPAGGIFCSLNDLIQYAKMLNKNGESLVSKSNFDAITSPHVISNLLKGSFGASEHFSFESYALGWHTCSYKGLNIVYHGGNIEGYSSILLHIPKYKTTIVILSNQNNSLFPYLTAGYLMDKISLLEPTEWLDTYEKYSKFTSDPNITPPPPETLRHKHTQHSLKLNEYVGAYQHPSFDKITISNENNTPCINFNNYKAKLEHWHYDTFITKQSTCPYFNNLLVQFIQNDKGEVSSIRVRLEKKAPSVTFKKDQNILYNNAILIKNLGQFNLEGTTVLLEAKNNSFYISIKNYLGYTYLHNEVVFKGKGLYTLRDYPKYTFFFSLNNEIPKITLITPENDLYSAIKKTNLILDKSNTILEKF